jgi:hypothetical protein
MKDHLPAVDLTAPHCDECHGHMTEIGFYVHETFWIEGSWVLRCLCVIMMRCKCGAYGGVEFGYN